MAVWHIDRLWPTEKNVVQIGNLLAQRKVYSEGHDSFLEMWTIIISMTVCLFAGTCVGLFSKVTMVLDRQSSHIMFVMWFFVLFFLLSAWNLVVVPVRRARISSPMYC